MPSRRSEFMALAKMAMPTALTQLGMMATGVVDTVMLGRLGVMELGASALGNLWQWSWLSLGLGLVMGIDPFVGQAHGRRDGHGVSLALQRGILLSVIASIPIAGLMLQTREGLLLLGQEPQLAAQAHAYNLWKLPTIPATLLYASLRQYLQGRTLMAPATWVMWIGNVLHLGLNWLLIFGHLGVPRLGLVGAAISSSVTMIGLVVGLVGWILAFRLHDRAWYPWCGASFSPRGLGQVVRVGLPSGIQLTVEGWGFSLAAMMAGWIGSTALASHQIVYNITTLAYMVPLGISHAACTRVSNVIGARDHARLRRVVLDCITLGASTMGAFAACFILFRHQIPRLYTESASARALSVQILPIAAAFQVFDGIQVVVGGVLRGMGKSAASAAVNLMGYFLLALPLAYMTTRYPVGLQGIWYGLAVGVTTVALCLLAWLRRLLKLPLEHFSVSSGSEARKSANVDTTGIECSIIRGPQPK